MLNEDCKNGVVLTFGNFDGIHLGHKLAISITKKISQEMNISSAVLTFEPHTSSVLSKKNHFRLIDHNHKVEMINDAGIDYLYIIDFDKSFSQLNYNDFISEILVKSYNVKHIVVGKNCTFGYKKLGNTFTLKEYAMLYDYTVTELDPLVIDNEVCSSSLIRDHLRCGKIDIANKFLGRPYQISGIVVKGACRGTEIGFPTINILIEDCMIKPKFGTYYARITYKMEWFYGVVNIGMRPTFQDLKRPILEMYIFNFNKNLYGSNVKIELLSFIRPEKKFFSVNELKKQINSDIVKAHQLEGSL
ncbi:MAG: bifunctional riboflavin kinase/FAD synthetase [Wolbachia endosymbiont of Fragariocoptes setiger]|nr:bifunctional riboflavin kinase/FAD synthetase [Wolbachia endosymbiont of Fragariocoptes setiger]